MNIYVLRGKRSDLGKIISGSKHKVMPTGFDHFNIALIRHEKRHLKGVP